MADSPIRDINIKFVTIVAVLSVLLLFVVLLAIMAGFRFAQRLETERKIAEADQRDAAAAATVEAGLNDYGVRVNEAGQVRYTLPIAEAKARWLEQHARPGDTRAETEPEPADHGGEGHDHHGGEGGHTRAPTTQPAESASAGGSKNVQNALHSFALAGDTAP